MDPKTRRWLLVADICLGETIAFWFVLGPPSYANEVWHGQALVQKILTVAGGVLLSWFAVLILMLLRWMWGKFTAMSRSGRIVLLVALALVAVFFGPNAASVARLLTRLIPVVFVAACGSWACLLVFRAANSRRWLRWLTPLAHLIVVATVAASLLVLFVRQLLTAEPAAGLLIPLAVWGSISAWLAMKKSERLAVRGAADITLSLLLGAVLVVFLVWLANLLNMPRPEVAILRAALTHAGAVVDLPWWVWTAVYMLLAMVSLAFVLRPARTATAKEWFGRVRVVPVANATRRLATGVHIGLLTIVLVGVSAPAALATIVQHKLSAAYTVALQSKFEAAGELAAYMRIQHQFDGGTGSGTFVQVVTQIHDADSPPAGDDNATSSEEDLAQRVGVLQATALNLASTKAVLDAAQTAARQAGLDGPLNSETDTEGRLAEVSAEDQDAAAEESSASTAGELAAAALASTISGPGLGGHEVVQVVREYLSGLVEDSGIKDTFAQWAGRLPAASLPPTTERLVEPDPAKLQTVAYNELAAEFAAAGQAGDINTDQAVMNTITESPITAAVTLANQSIQPDVTGCAGCTPYEPDDDFVPPDDGE